jgi:uncharacterized membrane protein
MDGVLLLATLAVGLLVGAPIVALIALTRVHQLERRVAELEARPATAVPSTLATSTRAPAHAAGGMPGAAPVKPAGTPPPTATPAPTQPARTSFDWETLIAGRWLNRIGLLAVAIGVSYFLKYVIDNEWIGPRGQVVLGVLLGAGLVAWSEVFVKRGLGYFGDGLAGLGGAVLYLSLWAGASYYRFVSTDVGFAAMIVVTAAMLAIALGRNSQSVAVLAMIGGFLTPWLVSTGRDAQVVLFLYLALHNSALLALARARDWRFLELPAFAFTQIYFWGWYDRFYTDTVLARTAVFTALFFAQFSVLPLIRVRRSGVLPPEQGVLVLVNAAVFLIALRALLWPEHRWALTLAALGLSAFHLVLARAMPARAVESPARLLYAGLALTFATLVIPIRLDGHWITLAWAVEAGVLAWSGFSAKLWFPRAAAYVMFAAVGLRLIGVPLEATEFLFNARLATALVVASSAAIAAWFGRRSRGQLLGIEAAIVAALAVAANVLVIWALTLEIDLYFQISPGRPDVFLSRSLTTSLLWTLYATALVMAGVRMKAAALRWQGLILFGMTTLKVFFSDLGYLSGLYRIASSIALGVVLLVVSFLYQRSLAARRSAQKGPP